MNGYAVYFLNYSGDLMDSHKPLNKADLWEFATHNPVGDIKMEVKETGVYLPRGTSQSHQKYEGTFEGLTKSAFIFVLQRMLRLVQANLHHRKEAITVLRRLFE